MANDHRNRSAGLVRNRVRHRTPRPAPRRRSEPVLESLESRVVLSATHTAPTTAALASSTMSQENQAYVDALMGSGLDGSAAQAKMARKLTAELDRGVPRERVVMQLLNSPASREVQVDSTYEAMLGHAPTKAELHAGMAIVGRSGDTRPLEEKIIGSSEYMKVRGHGNRTGFVTAMYEDVLGRAPTSSELAAGRKTLAGGASRTKMASALMNTKAARNVLVRDIQAAFGVSVQRQQPGTIGCWSGGAVSRK